MFNSKSMFGIDVSLSPSVEPIIQEKNISKNDISVEDDKVSTIDAIRDNSPSEQKDQIVTNLPNNNQNLKQKEYKSDIQLDEKIDQHDDEFLY